MSTDMDELSERARALSRQLQDVIRDLGASWGEQGKQRVRRAVGAPGDEAIWGMFLVGAVVGMFVGAALALVLAPRPGAQTREAIAGTARRAMRRSGDGRPASAPTYAAPADRGPYGETGPVS